MQFCCCVGRSMAKTIAGMTWVDWYADAGWESGLIFHLGFRLWNEQLRSNGACVPSTLCTAGLYICFLCWQRLETQSPFCNMTAASPWLIHNGMNSCDLMVHVHKSRNPCACCVQCSLDWQVLRYNHHSAVMTVYFSVTAALCFMFSSSCPIYLWVDSHNI